MTDPSRDSPSACAGATAAVRTRRGGSPHHRNSRHDDGGQADTVNYLPLRIVRRGITRRATTRTAADLPLTRARREVLDLVGQDLMSPGPIAQALGRSSAGVTASLFALADRGLIERIPYKGWRRTQPTTCP